MPGLEQQDLLVPHEFSKLRSLLVTGPSRCTRSAASRGNKSLIPSRPVACRRPLKSRDSCFASPITQVTGTRSYDGFEDGAARVGRNIGSDCAGHAPGRSSPAGLAQCLGGLPLSAQIEQLPEEKMGTRPGTSDERKRRCHCTDMAGRLAGVIGTRSTVPSFEIPAEANDSTFPGQVLLGEAEHVGCQYSWQKSASVRKRTSLRKSRGDRMRRKSCSRPKRVAAA